MDLPIEQGGQCPSRGRAAHAKSETALRQRVGEGEAGRERQRRKDWGGSAVSGQESQTSLHVCDAGIGTCRRSPHLSSSEHGHERDAGRHEVEAWIIRAQHIGLN